VRAQKLISLTIPQAQWASKQRNFSKLIQNIIDQLRGEGQVALINPEAEGMSQLLGIALAQLQQRQGYDTEAQHHIMAAIQSLKGESE